jgi:tetratricopeptide (TPR) repeat protein
VSGHATSSIGALERADGWAPIRRHFGIGAFGVNAWTGRKPGDTIIPEHDEDSGHEELYVVTEGVAVFTVAGEQIEAPAGTLVHVSDPATMRGAVAQQAPATVLAVGAAPGEPFSPRAWELNRDVLPLFERGDYAGAKRTLEQALPAYPDDPAPILFNLACAEARLGEKDEALAHLADAIAREPRFAEYAPSDEDLASLRDDPRFPA